ncbi:hypothetical protein [Meiothermus sp.]|nr:hypothetical protein [Meiothermus sp.]GIW34767.1 MAG: hypothetical protein KatS3mg072_2100 [Meiothermus sp.]
MTSHAQNPLKNLLNRDEIKPKASARYVVSIFSAVVFLGWLVLEMILGF